MPAESELEKINVGTRPHVFSIKNVGRRSSFGQSRSIQTFYVQLIYCMELSVKDQECRQHIDGDIKRSNGSSVLLQSLVPPEAWLLLKFEFWLLCRCLTLPMPESTTFAVPVLHSTHAREHNFRLILMVKLSQAARIPME